MGYIPRPQEKHGKDWVYGDDDIARVKSYVDDWAARKQMRRAAGRFLPPQPSKQETVLALLQEILGHVRRQTVQSER